MTMLGGDCVFSLADAVIGCFFFQAEDGIRDTSVTGVQTCALPISLPAAADDPAPPPARARSAGRAARARARSEERRVGKESRSRWSRYHEIKKMTEIVTIRSSTERSMAKSSLCCTSTQRISLLAR